MKVLVTGHRGFIGQNMVKELEKNNHEWVGYEWGDRPYSLKGIDRVIHIGAISSTTYQNTRQLLLQNYYFTEKLLIECGKKGIPFQFSSSASVYGVDNETFREIDQPAPRNYYSFSKLMVEEYCNTHEFPMPVQLFRYFNVYGPGEENKGDQASPVHKFRKQQEETGEIKIFEGSENYHRDFVHVGRVTDVHMKFLNIPESGIWNVGTGNTKSFLDIAKEIQKETDCKIVEVPMPDTIKHSYQKFTKADTTKLYNTIHKYSNS